ncbi:MAG TPA: hypothetical protein VG847_11640 [Chitinophagaceae bacterium]|nr:hypothetical protein [Chitinophagaceae bacterium]
MQYFKILLLGAIAIMTISFTKAQSADDIINRYIDSIGGKDNLSHITSVHTQASASMMGTDAPIETTLLNGKGYRSEAQFNGQTLVRVYTDKGGWAINPFEGGGNAQAMDATEYKSVKDDIYVGGSLYNYAVNHTGKADLEGTDGNAYKIVYTAPDSAASTFYIDTTSYLLTKMVRTGFMQGQQVDVATSLSDYKKIDGNIVVPFTLNIDFGGNFSMTTTVKSVDVNKPVDPGIFEMPK